MITSGSQRQACKQFLSVIRSFVWLETNFDLTRSQSGRTKHIFPSRVYANCYNNEIFQVFKVF